jgi:hypothetical protein
VKVYKSEIEDKLDDKIQANASVELFIPIQVKKEATASLDEDLYPLKSILVSTGWNKNMDIFTKEDTWAARKTAINKKIDFQHDELKIIGHITSAYVMSDDYVPDDTPIENVPNDFHIITEGVLYTHWKDPERQQLMASIIGGIEEDKWYVSMECLFDDFDYAIRDGQDTQIIARDETSAFLTKHLRSFGGSGKYEGKEIGRVLRNFTFSGKGIVSNPANPNSIILDVEDNDIEKNLEIDYIESEEISVQFPDFVNSSVSNIKGENNMSEELKTQLKEANDKIASLEKQLHSVASLELEKSVKSLETQLATASVEKATVVAEKSEIEHKLTATEQALENLKNELAEAKKLQEAALKEKAEMAKKSKCAERASKLVEAGLDSEDAQSKSEAWVEVSDDVFNGFVEAMKKSKPAAKDPAPKESMCSEEVLENATPEETVTPVESNDNADSTKAIAECLASFLKSNKPKKESK